VSIHRFLISSFVLLIVLLGALFASLMRLAELHDMRTESEHRRYVSYKLADELRQSSDDLTRMARLFVATGEERFAEYFDEILAIRMGKKPRPTEYDLVYWDLVDENGTRPRPNGEAISLDDLMVAQGFTVEEFRKLTEARERSDGLVRMEAIAMNAIRGQFVDDTGRFSRAGDSDPELARTIMFGPEYLSAKAQIMTPINEFLQLLDQRTMAEVDNLRARGRRLMVLSLIISFAALSLSILAIFWLHRRVLRPLGLVSAATKKVAQGEFEHQVDYHSRDEFGNLVTVFNSMVEETRGSVSELQASNRSLEEHRKDLEREKQVSEGLLLNVLPAVIAQRLRDGETTIADEFPEVSVMFADLVDFTTLAEKLGPFELVGLLNDLFEMFDERLDEFELEKIKTIGDCYMVVAGIPVPQVDHAQRIAEFALAVRDDFARFVKERGLKIDLRIGMHSGTAIAGVVGTRKFAYDLWGDVVNVASRIESSGSPGKIHVSDAFMIRVKDSFLFEDHGTVDLKGKDPMHTYYLKKKRYQPTQNSSLR